MRTFLPSSHGCFKVRLSVFDTVWAAISPLLALYIRDAFILSFDGARTAALYCGISLAFSIIAFLAFRISDGVSRYFSVHDALKVAKAAVAAGVMTALVIFTFTRLEGIPRSTPFIHVLILLAGLITARTLALLRNPERQVLGRPDDSAIEHIIIIGSNRLSSLYIKFIPAYSPERHRIIAVLDDEPRLIGRAIVGVPVIATPQNLEPVIDEFSVHGVRTDRIIIGGDEGLLSEEELARIRRVCEQREICLDFVPRLIGLSELQAPRKNIELKVVENWSPVVSLPPYFRVKPFLGFFVAIAAVIVLSPLFITACLLVLLDVGSPVLFWQQRIGQGGSNFLLHKFRTLRPPFDWQGQPVPEDRRLSWIGRLLRKTRLDELPQLFNVLVGDMSLIGPRPLLPHDQPTNPSVRLSARPGITGWAQVNGGNLVTVDEKGALDEWYIRNASLWLDLRIVGLTFLFLLTGERRSEQAVVDARAVQKASYLWKNPAYSTRDVGSARARSAGRAVNAMAASTTARSAAGSIRPRQ